MDAFLVLQAGFSQRYCSKNCGKHYSDTFFSIYSIVHNDVNPVLLLTAFDDNLYTKLLSIHGISTFVWDLV